MALGNSISLPNNELRGHVGVVEPRFNEVAGDRPNLFVKWRIRYIENLDIAKIFVYKHCFCYFNVELKYETKELFVSPANSSLVGTLITIGDVTVILAITNLKGTTKMFVISRS